MSGGAIAAIVVGGVVVVGGGIGIYAYSRRRYYLPPLPAGRVAYAQTAAKHGPDLVSQVLGAATSMADAYIKSDAGSEQIAGWLSS